MAVIIHTEEHVNLKPPTSTTGIIGWVRANLCNTWYNSLFSLLIIYILWQVMAPFINWALINANWTSSGAECHQSGGACWSIIHANIRFILFGFYPPPEQWRPLTAMIILFSLLIASRNRNWWSKNLLYTWLAGLIIMGLLMKGGLFGLTSIESDQWGGLPLTLMLSVFGLAAAYPLGVALALGRQSRLPVIKSLTVIYIEMIRGVPLISLLFMSAIIFPLFLPEGITINKILRAQVAIIMFTAAYVAEVVRGGLQAMPKGQYEAADSLGLNYFQTMRLIILPQALKIVIPPTVSVLISAFKDTSLVVIIALYDVLKTTQSTLSNPQWMGFSTEAYLFVGMIYFVCCYFMSTWSRRLEIELHTGR
ncbi:MAG: amino acid ABC transporter permease [Deltaproteobacteria bacterium]|nr:amino acid ABC transporter permease [Candidatus Tharpella aukensis]